MLLSDTDAYNLCASEEARDLARLLREQADAMGWRDIATAPRDEVVLGLVSGKARLIKFGKTSHVPMHGWCLADQGAEDFDLADPTGWQPLPPPPQS